MKEVYVIKTDNGGWPEDFESIDLGFVETEKEAKDTIEKLIEEQRRDSDIVDELDAFCCNCDKNGDPCRNCSVVEENRMIESKVQYCHCLHIEEAHFSYKKLERM